MAKRRKRHTEEFKREAVLALESRGDRSIEDVAKGLGLSASQLHAWRKTQGIDARRSKTGETVEQELARLRRENANLRKDREVLKKSIAFFVQDRT
jgi:transposase